MHLQVVLQFSELPSLEVFYHLPKFQKDLPKVIMDARNHKEERNILLRILLPSQDPNRFHMNQVA